MLVGPKRLSVQVILEADTIIRVMEVGKISDMRVTFEKRASEGGKMFFRGEILLRGI